ncbi:MAG: response regulator [Proteobacteria bacterium]|nr:response regulator [Pseudomonadota bacterium]
MNNAKKATILIVDDMPANLGVLSDMLTSSGYSVRPAHNGRIEIRDRGGAVVSIFLPIGGEGV